MYETSVDTPLHPGQRVVNLVCAVMVRTPRVSRRHASLLGRWILVSCPHSGLRRRRLHPLVYAGSRKQYRNIRHSFVTSVGSTGSRSRTSLLGPTPVRYPWSVGTPPSSGEMRERARTRGPAPEVPVVSPCSSRLTGEDTSPFVRELEDEDGTVYLYVSCS